MPANLRPVPQSLRQIAKEQVETYRDQSLNAEAYRRLAALADLEFLMDQHGTEWVEIQAQRLATERRLRGLR